MKFIDLIEQELVSLEESSLSRIQSKIAQYDTGAISAFRGERDKATNAKNSKALRIYMIQRGYSVTPVKGAYLENFGSVDQKEVSEPSYFVADHNNLGGLEKTLMQLGRLYDQDSILFVPKGGKAYLVGTSQRPNGWPNYMEKVTVGSPKFGKVAGEFLSRVKGREFAFESVEKPDSMHGRWGWKMLEEQVQLELDALPV